MNKAWIRWLVIAMTVLVMSPVARSQSKIYPPNTVWVRSEGLVSVLYNKRADVTTVGISIDLIHRDKLGRIEFATDYSVPGTAVVPPNEVELRFLSYSKRARFGSDILLILTCGTDTVRFPAHQYMAKQDSPDGSEFVEFVVPFDAFSRLASCDSLSWSVNNVPMKVSPEMLASLRVMASMPSR